MIPRSFHGDSREKSLLLIHSQPEERSAITESLFGKRRVMMEKAIYIAKGKTE
jgi:hypothetical protein